MPSPDDTSATTAPLLPARMVNEYVYCPRLAYLEWVQGEWADSADTVTGRHAHRRVDRARGSPPEATAAEVAAERIHVHSLELSSERLGLIARLDLATFEGRRAVPVDYKRGRRPHVAQGAYDPERVQLCAQGLLLTEHGYQSEEGVLYYVSSRERVRVPFDADLVATTHAAIEGLRRTALGGVIPPPLDNSPKCPRCSLAAICLPDELHYLARQQTPPRPLAVGHPPALPLYVQARGAKVAKAGEVLEISVDDAVVAQARLGEISQVVLQGGVYLTSPALHELMARGIPVTWASHGGWVLGHTIGLGHKNVELRTAQYRASFDARHCLRLARRSPPPRSVTSARCCAATGSAARCPRRFWPRSVTMPKRPCTHATCRSCSASRATPPRDTLATLGRCSQPMPRAACRSTLPAVTAARRQTR
jgi:CRISPR-associated protein Cas4